MNTRAISASIRHFVYRHRRLFLSAMVLVFVACIGMILHYTMPQTVVPRHGDAYVRKNIPYCNTKNPEQVIDIYRPNDGGSNRPVVVYIHGGGWRTGRRGNALIRHYAPLFQQKGIAVIDVGYRLKTSSPFPDQNNDVACALHFLTEHQRTYEIDMGNAVLFGDSAGGQLAAYAALNVTYARYPYIAPRGVIDFYGVSDFTTIVLAKKPDMNARFYLGAQYGQDANAASPIAMVHAGAPPFLLIHGARDGVVPVSQSREFAKRLRASRIPVDIYVVPRARHGFVGPELPQGEYDQIRQKIFKFLDQTLD